MTEEKESCQCEEREQVKREIALKLNLGAIKKKLLILSGKGGVGKSTVSSNLAAGLSSKGYKVGLLDIDIHGPNIPNMFGLEGFAPMITDLGIMPIVYSENLKLISIGFFLEQRDTAVVWRGPIKHRMIENFLTDVRWGELDFLVVDSPPGTGDEIISIVQVLDKVDGAIIVATPQDVALADVRRTVKFCKDAAIPIVGIVENMSGFICPHCGKTVEIFKSGGAEKLAEAYKIPFLGRIPLDPSVVMSGDEGKPFMLFNPDSELAKAFSKIIDKVLDFK